MPLCIQPKRPFYFFIIRIFLIYFIFYFYLFFSSHFSIFCSDPKMYSLSMTKDSLFESLIAWIMHLRQILFIIKFIVIFFFLIKWWKTPWPFKWERWRCPVDKWWRYTRNFFFLFDCPTLKYDLCILLFACLQGVCVFVCV